MKQRGGCTGERETNEVECRRHRTTEDEASRKAHEGSDANLNENKAWISPRLSKPAFHEQHKQDLRRNPGANGEATRPTNKPNKHSSKKQLKK